MEDKHFTTLFDKLDEDRKGDKVYCDVTISVGDANFSAHRCILGTFCLYFATLFRSSFDDKNKEVIKLSGPVGEDIKPSTFQSILNFCYTKQSGLKASNVYDVLAATEYLQIDNLKKECLDFLKASLANFEDWLRIYRTAMQWNYTSLLDNCMTAFLEVRSQLDLREFTFEEIHSIIKYSSEMMKSEEVFEMITSWVDHQPDDNKQKHFDQLVEFVNFGWMDAAYLSDNVATNEFIINSAVGQKRLSAYDDEKFLLLGGVGAKNSIQKYIGDTWQKCVDSLKPIHYAAVASNDTHVFVVGGRDAEGFEADHIQVYAIQNDTWSVFEHVLKRPRYGATATIIIDKLYVFGGFCNDYLTSTEVFEINGSSCTPCNDHGVPDLKVPRAGYPSVTRNNEVYLIGGGTTNHETLSSCELINVASSKGTELAPLIQARGCPSAVLFRSRIIVLGGACGPLFETTLNSGETYSFDTKQWTMMMLPMTTPRYRHCSIVYKGQLFVIGGQNGPDDVNNIEVYDPDSKQWKVQSNLTRSRYCSSVVKL